MTTPILTSEELVNIKHTVLTIQRQEIARNIDPKRFFGHLRSKYVFDESDCDEIRAVPSRIGSAELFVDTLKRKGGRGYDEFCNALMSDKTQVFLLQRLNQTLELLKAKVLERKKSLQQLKNPSAQYPVLHSSSNQPSHQLHPQIKPNFHPPHLPTQHSNLPRHLHPPVTMPMSGMASPSNSVPNHSFASHLSYSPGTQYPTNAANSLMPQLAGQINSPSAHRPLRKIQSRQSEKDMMMQSGYNSTDSPSLHQHHPYSQQQFDCSHSPLPPTHFLSSSVELPSLPDLPQDQQNHIPLRPQAADPLSRQHINANPTTFQLHQHHNHDNLVGMQYGDWHSPVTVPDWRNSLNSRTSLMPPMYPVHRGIDSSFLTDSRCGHNMEMMSRTGEDIDVPCGQMILARGSE